MINRNKKASDSLMTKGINKTRKLNKEPPVQEIATHNVECVICSKYLPKESFPLYHAFKDEIMHPCKRCYERYNKENQALLFERLCEALEGKRKNGDYGIDLSGVVFQYEDEL